MQGTEKCPVAIGPGNIKLHVNFTFIINVYN